MNDARRRDILVVRGLELGFGETPLLTGVSFSLSAGEFCYLVGPTGSGKSTLLRSIYADFPIQGGELFVDDQPVSRLPLKEVPLLRRKLGIVFQDFLLLPEKNLEGNLDFVLRATGWRNRNKRLAKINEVLMKVGLSGKIQAMPHQLSGGEQQRAAIARALLNDPLLIIADEPTGNLDPFISRQILELLLKIHHGGTAVLMATHDYALIERYPGRVLSISDGRVQDFAESTEFLARANL